MPYTGTDPKIYYETDGDPCGTPLVFIGGMIYPHDVWFLQREFFKDKGFFTVFLDNRDSGRSGRADADYTIKDMAGDVVSVMDSLGIDKAHVVGASMGGLIAQDLAAFYPERVERLVLICTHYGCSDYTERVANTWNKILLSVNGLTLREIYLRGVSFALSKRFFEKRKDVVEFLVGIRERLPQEPAAFFRQFRAASTFCSKGYLQRITSPTLVLGGTRDVVVPKDLVEGLSKLIPGAKAVFFDTGHLVFIEEPDAVNREILSFLLS